jgi:Xaa-Pro aminopeptidase
MIFTVEIPGYDIPKWREMGSFMEDMYLITESGFENLSKELPRQIFVC